MVFLRVGRRGAVFPGRLPGRVIGGGGCMRTRRRWRCVGPGVKTLPGLRDGEERAGYVHGVRAFGAEDEIVCPAVLIAGRVRAGASMLRHLGEDLV